MQGSCTGKPSFFLSHLNIHALQQGERRQYLTAKTPLFELINVSLNQGDGTETSDVSKMKHHTPVMLDFDLRLSFFQCQHRYV
jgi:hypothetical protein